MSDTKGRVSDVTGKTVVDYVDNETFTAAMHSYVTRQNERELQELPRENIPNYIGECILKIVDGLGSRPNFRNYTYLEEMKGDAMVAAVKAVHKFDIERCKTGAFGFITFCAWRFMVNRIKLEHKQQAIKESMIIDPTFEFYETMGHNDNAVNIDKENSIDTYFQGKL